MRFRDMITIVTGGARGIGRAIAHGFAKEGSMVIILDLLEKDAENVVKEIVDKRDRSG